MRMLREFLVGGRGDDRLPETESLGLRQAASDRGDPTDLAAETDLPR